MRRYLPIILVLVFLPFVGSAARVIHLPPLFGNQDHTNQVDTLNICYDFSLINLGTFSQQIEITLRSNSFVTYYFEKPGSRNQSNMGKDIVFSMTLSQPGEAKRGSFCSVCTGNGCDHGTLTSTDGSIGVEGANFTSPSPYFQKSNWVYFHSTHYFQLRVKEDRGAVSGRVTGRFFNNNMYNATIKATSPPVELAINGGRPF